MSYLEIRNLTKRFGTFTAVDNFNLNVEKGEMVALLGASGCGKTTILRMVAGFLEPTGGDILIDGKVVNKIPSYKRNVGIFFQNYALFPHMTVFDNVAYSLKLKKMDRETIGKKVTDIIQLVKLQGLEKRYPRELSGGQQQRVALARAIIMEPTVLLLDEPLSNLDAKLRVDMQVEIKQIQRKLNITTIIVTHDQEEAVSLADKVLVMNAGHLLQEGAPEEIFDHPSSPFIADFMGFTNFIHGTVEEKDSVGYTVRSKGTGKTVRIPLNRKPDMQKGTEVTLCVRPRNIHLSGEKTGTNVFTGKVAAVTYKGNISLVDVTDAFDAPVHLNIADYDGPQAGEEITFFIPEEKLLAYVSTGTD